jgi:hemerythrin-like domain-containing protein
MKATALLKKQHREVADLFSKALAATAPRLRQQFRDEIRRQLEMHTAIEEEIFYPAVRELGTAKALDMIGEAVEEHHVVKLVLAELPRLEPDADNYEAKITVLKELIEHHVEEEHEEMFPLAAKKLDFDELKKLGEHMQARADELLGTMPSRKSA